MAKKIGIGTRPVQKARDVDQWVSERQIESEPIKPLERMKRLTLDIPESMHRTLKKKAADEGVAMADMLRELLEKHMT